MKTILCRQAMGLEIRSVMSVTECSVQAYGQNLIQVFSNLQTFQLVHGHEHIQNQLKAFE